jgi:hypothetical protein
VPATITVVFDDDLDAGAATLLAVLKRGESPAEPVNEDAEVSERDAA